MTRLEKGRIVAELLNSMTDEKHQGAIRVVLPADFGARVCETQLFKILEDLVLPKYEAQIWSDTALDLVITAYVNLISTMINNEPNLVSVLLKGADEQPAVINKLLAAIVKSAPKTQTYQYIQSDAFESICLKLFARLSVTENGRKVVNENAKSIVEQLLSAKTDAFDAVYYMG